MSRGASRRLFGRLARQPISLARYQVVDQGAPGASGYPQILPVSVARWCAQVPIHPHGRLWINLWKLWIAQSLLHVRIVEDALRATTRAHLGPAAALRTLVALARLVRVIQVCSQCGTRWNVRDRQRGWCPRCNGALMAPVNPPDPRWSPGATSHPPTRPPGPQRGGPRLPQGFRWIAVRPGPPPAAASPSSSPRADAALRLHPAVGPRRPCRAGGAGRRRRRQEGTGARHRPRGAALGDHHLRPGGGHPHRSLRAAVDQPHVAAAPAGRRRGAVARRVGQPGRHRGGDPDRRCARRRG